MTKTTILQVIPELNTGGAELSTLEIAQAVVEAGGRALVVTEGGRLEGDIIQAGGEIIKHPVATKNPIKIYKNAGFLAKLIKAENVDLVHARSRAPAWSAWIAAKRTKCPFVTTYHGAYGNKEPFKNYYNRIMARGDIVIANSEYTADLVRQQHNPDEVRLRVIHRGVDLKRFDKGTVGSERMHTLLEQWRVKPDQRIILQAARLTSWKGQEVLIDAAALLKSQGLPENIIFILAGDDQGRTEYRENLLAKIRDNGLESAIRLTGHCSDIAGAFAISHASVVASTEPEAFGRAAVESQAMECPVVVTDIGATKETVVATPEVDDSRITGWRIPPNDPQSLAKALDKLILLSEEERHSMGIRARTHVSQNFSLDQMKSKTLNVYDELIGSNLSQLLEKS